ncbi:fatty acid desaturase family protein [Luteimicrobium sp. NPDC057192]|uniref:fatty acid desaturase family protein n=1 Tax=Luteimicrobium sp. NPDC057192 TaxID=3346042 RepID=UPI00362EBFF9
MTTTTAAPDRPNRVTSSFTELSRTVRERGLLARTTGFYVTLLAVLGVALAAIVAGVVALGSSWWQLALAAALGVVMTQLAFVAHEAAHRQVFSSGPANDRLGRVLANAVVGISYSWWTVKHSRHHANPNKVDADPDIAEGVVSFLPEHAARARGVKALINRYQGWLFFPLLTLEGVNLHVTSLRSTAARVREGSGRGELVTLVLRLVAGVAFVLWAMPLGLGLAFLAVWGAVLGVYMGASFAPNHKGMTILSPTSRVDFLSKQVLTSRNIRGGWGVNLLMGGLGSQVEHHLFPSMPRPHLIAARRLVRQHCADVGVPYTETSLRESYGIVVRHLNEVGLSARDPFDCPTFHRLRR